MATNSTLLAIQCGAGVPVPRCHLRRNLAPAPYCTANPAVQYGADALALVSTPSQLHRNLVAKRDKTIVSAFPIYREQYQTDIPEYTDGIVENHSGEVLRLGSVNIWEGSSAEFPAEIPLLGTGRFKQNVDSRCPNIGSVGGLAYEFGEGRKLIIAWRNSKNEVNKVYTKILFQGEVVEWNEIKLYLDKSGKYSENERFPFVSEASIDASSATPTARTIFKSLLIPNQG